ncbi:MAG: EAL domain-containing protein, partial [Burkholderiales bacterium]|nr:EAL domain-containing protein [Burkholderiales bacterium]
MSLYRQLWLAIVTSMLLALGGGLLASLVSARSYLESQLSIKNTDNATALALSLSLNNQDATMVELTVASLFDGGHYEWIRVSNPQGGLLTERVAPAGDVDAPAWFVRLLPIRAQAGRAQISNGWKQVGVVTLASHSRFAYGALWKSAYEMVAALILAGLVGGLLGALILQRLRSPLNAVVQQANAISQRRFVVIEEPKVPELRQLAVAMNTTVGRLKHMFDEEAARLELMRLEAHCDPLTGLFNRSHFLARLQQSLVADDAVAGSLLLVRLADLLAARLNGADFALLLPGEELGRVGAEALMQELVEKAGPFLQDGPVAAIGVGHFVPGMELSALLTRVDAALASAQAANGNVVQEALQEPQGGELRPQTSEQWSKLILGALDKQWVALAAFPVVALSGQLLHQECPMRLKLGLDEDWLPAARFFPVAERLRLTPAIDLMALSLGLRTLREQPGLPGLAINLSGHSLSDAAFLQKISALLEPYRDVAPRLWVEVSETSAYKHFAAFRALCRLLKAAHCRVGLEHFGYHFSQIGSLHDLGLDYLKVDASFIREIDRNSGNAVFLKGLTGIAHNIGLQVLAEGVASDAELQV